MAGRLEIFHRVCVAKQINIDNIERFVHSVPHATFLGRGYLNMDDRLGSISILSIV